MRSLGAESSVAASTLVSALVFDPCGMTLSSRMWRNCDQSGFVPSLLLPRAPQHRLRLSNCGSRHLRDKCFNNQPPKRRARLLSHSNYRISSARDENDAELLRKIRPLYDQHYAEKALRHQGNPLDHDTLAQLVHQNPAAFQASFQDAVKARNKLLLNHIHIVYTAAARVSKLANCEHADLVQEGAIALMRAAERFDMERLHQVKFSTYAYRAVWTAIWRGVAPASDIIRVPSRLRESLFRRNAPNKLSAAQAKRLRALLQPVRLDRPVSRGQSTTLGDLLPTERPTPASAMQQECLRKEVRDACFRSLPKRWACVLSSRFGLEDETPQTIKVVAAKFGVSEPRITQIVLAAMERLRQKEPGLAKLIYDL